MARPLLAIAPYGSCLCLTHQPWPQEGFLDISRQPGAGIHPPRSRCCQPRVTSPPYTPIFQGLPEARCRALTEPGAPAHQGCFLLLFPLFLEGPQEHSEDLLLSASSCTRWLLAKGLEVHKCQFEPVRQTSLVVGASRCPSIMFSSQDTFSSSIKDLSDKGEGVSCVFGDTCI